jgi:hypothetical protein
VRSIDALHAALRAVDARDREPQAHVDGLLRVVVGVPDEQPVALQRTGQEFLGQRGPLVGQQAFVPDQRDGSAVSAPTQRLDRLASRLASTHDHHLVHPIAPINKSHGPGRPSRTNLGRCAPSRANLVPGNPPTGAPIPKLPLCWAFGILARKLHCD